MWVPQPHVSASVTLVTSTTNTAQSDFWNNIAGPVWVEEKTRLDRMSEHFLNGALQRLAPEVGERALDVGCGTGASTAALAEAVGSEGGVVGVDICRVMLDAAKSALSEHQHVELYEADAETFRPTEPVDLVFSRFGVMFFADPHAAFDNLRQSLTLGGRMGFLCWRGRQENEWATVPTAAAASVVDLPSSDPAAPGPFRMQSGAEIVELLIGAGFDDVGVEALDHELAFPLQEACEFFSRVGPMAAFLREADDTQRPALHSALRSALEERQVAGEVRFRAGAWWVSARRDE